MAYRRHHLDDPILGALRFNSTAMTAAQVAVKIGVSTAEVYRRMLALMKAGKVRRVDTYYEVTWGLTMQGRRG